MVKLISLRLLMSLNLIYYLNLYFYYDLKINLIIYKKIIEKLYNIKQSETWLLIL